jgi:uncharacterized protein YbjT (DUF2867 family)
MATGLHVAQVEHFHSKLVAEQYVANSGLPYTLIGTVWFMDNLLDRKNGGAMTFPVLKGSLNADTQFEMLCVDDLGAAVNHVFRNAHVYAGKKINLAGDRMTVSQMEALYEAIGGRKAPRLSIPNWMMRFMHNHFAQQLRWHNRNGFSFDLKESREHLPSIRSWREYLTANCKSR